MVKEPIHVAEHERRAPELALELDPRASRGESSQVITLPIAKSQTRSQQNKEMHKFSSVYSERGVLLLVLTSGGERIGVRACGDWDSKSSPKSAQKEASDDDN